MGSRPRGRTTARVAAGVGRRRQGVCPVCRAARSLRDTDGKMMPHGRTAASPRGCPGNGQAPVRDARPEGPGAA